MTAAVEGLYEFERFDHRNSGPGRWDDGGLLTAADATMRRRRLLLRPRGRGLEGCKDRSFEHDCPDGGVRALQEVDVMAKVSGYVREIKVDIGDRVKEGECWQRWKFRRCRTISRGLRRRLKRRQPNWLPRRMNCSARNRARHGSPLLFAHSGRFQT